MPASPPSSLPPLRTVLRRSLGFLLLAACLFRPVLAQYTGDRQETERRLQELQEQIALDQARLSQAAEAEEASVKALEDLDREIVLREELTKNYRRRLQQLSFEGDSLRNSLRQLEREMAKQKAQYRRHAVHGYKYGRLHDLALILAARDVNQMLVRVRYLHRFGEQRREKLAYITQIGKDLKARREALQATRETTEQLLAEAQAEEENLTRLRADRHRLVEQLRAERALIEEKLVESQAAAQQLQARIRDLVAAESARRSTATATEGAAAAAAYVELSGSFRQNRGQLPWPSQGVVQERFGNRVNPVYGTTTANPGVLIATNASAEVRAIFSGEVVLVDVMPDYGTLVTIAHGEYKTVYSNFSLLYVTRGDRVRAGQVIGRAGTDSEPRGRAVFFALFENGEAIDPLPWLRPR